MDRASPLVRVGSRELQLSHLDKLYWPDDGITKAELLAYYQRVGPTMLPHLEDRPLSMRRYPDGIRAEGFFQKQAPDFTPPWVRQVPIRTDRRTIDFVLCADLATLAWLVNLGCIDQNPWHSRVPHLQEPDYVLFDLDPFAPAGLAEALEVGLMLKDLLDELGLTGYPKLSGATGFHVYVPIRRGYTYGLVRLFAGQVGRRLMERAGHLITMEWAVSRRTGKVFFDHNMNTQGKTIASVYSARPFPGATVSTPLGWHEVHPGLDPRDYTIRTIFKRLERWGDLFSPVLSHKQALEPAIQRLISLPR